MLEEKRNQGLDVLRFFSCAGIIWLHYRAYTCPAGIYFGSYLVNDDTSGFELKYLVELFFCISGYLCYYSVRKIRNGQSFWQYFKPKLVRFIPMLTIGTVLCEVLLGALVRRNVMLYEGVTEPTLWGILSSCFGVQEGWGFINSRVNPESWFMDVLLLCFILFYFSVWISQRIKADETIIYATLVLVGAGAVSSESGFPFMTYMAGRGYEAFFMGVLVGEYKNRRQMGKKEQIVSVIGILVYLLYHFLDPGLLRFGKNHLMALMVSPALIVLTESTFLKKLLSWKGFSLCGKICFSTYIIHICVIYAVQLLADIAGMRIAFDHEVVLFTVMILTFLTGLLLYVGVERRLINYINSNKT